MANRLNVDRRNICDRSHAMGKIQMAGKWVLHQLNDRQIEKCKIVCEALLSRHEKNTFFASDRYWRQKINMFREP